MSAAEEIRDVVLPIVGNHLAEIDGERAVAETYGTAVHWGEPADDPGRNFTTGFRDERDPLYRARRTLSAEV